MPIALNKQQISTSFYDRALKAYLRIVAIVLIWFALRYWAMIVGMEGTPFGGFDRMPEYWRATSAGLSVLLPVAAVGLWGRFPWGVFIWLLAIACEVAMYSLFSGLFGRNDQVLVFHAATFLAYLMVRLASLATGRRKRAA